MDKQNVTEKDRLKGGLADNLTVADLARRHKVPLNVIKQQLAKGVEVEYEHTNNKKIAREIAMDHIFEDPYYYNHLAKMEKESPTKKENENGKEGEQKEQTMSGSSGSFEAPMGGGAVKRPIKTIHNSEISEEDEEKPKKGEYKEATTSAVSAAGQYDAPFGGSGRHVKSKVKTQEDALKIGTPDSIKAAKIGKDKSGPYNYAVDVKDKCKKFPYCNQGDINALNIKQIAESINIVSEKYGLSKEYVTKLVLNEIKDIFM